MLLIAVKKESDRYASRRKFIFADAQKKKLIKKITPETLKQEVLTARILGELSAVERIIEALVKNPELDREQLEAELQLFVVGCNNTAASLLGSDYKITVENVLDVHGYYNKGENK